MNRRDFYFHIAKHLHFREFLYDKYNDLLLADTLRMVALSMVSVFIPIFLVELGFAVKDVALMMLGVYLGSILVHWLVLSIIGNFGVKNTMIFSYATTIIMYGLLFNYELILAGMSHTGFLVMIMGLEIVTQTCYWTSHHIYFMQSTDEVNSGQKLGLLVAVPAIFGIVSPFIGSIVITEFGFEGAFFLSGILMIVGACSLFYSSDIKTRINLKLGRVLDIKQGKKNLILYIQGMGYAGTSFYWPLLMFVQSIKILSMGFLYLLSNIAYAVVSYLSGRNCDKSGAKKAGRLGAVGWGLSVVFRSIFANLGLITFFQTMGGLFGGLLHTTLDADFFRAGHNHIGNSIMNREFYMHSGRATLAVAFLIMLLYFDVKTALVSVLVLSGSITVVLSLLIGNKNFDFDN